jgi:hypothetical protein
VFYQATSQRDTSDEALVDVCALAEQTAQYFGEAGLYQNARDLLAALLPLRERIQGAEHTDTLTTTHKLARWTGKAGDPAGARDQLAVLLPSVERIQGVEHPDTRTTGTNSPTGLEKRFAAAGPEGREHRRDRTAIEYPSIRCSS